MRFHHNTRRKEDIHHGGVQTLSEQHLITNKDQRCESLDLSEDSTMMNQLLTSPIKVKTLGTGGMILMTSLTATSSSANPKSNPSTVETQDDDDDDNNRTSSPRRVVHLDTSFSSTVASSFCASSVDRKEEEENRCLETLSSTLHCDSNIVDPALPDGEEQPDESFSSCSLVATTRTPSSPPLTRKQQKKMGRAQRLQDKKNNKSRDGKPPRPTRSRALQQQQHHQQIKSPFSCNDESKNNNNTSMDYSERSERSHFSLKSFSLGSFAFPGSGSICSAARSIRSIRSRMSLRSRRTNDCSQRSKNLNNKNKNNTNADTSNNNNNNNHFNFPHTFSPLTCIKSLGTTFTMAIPKHVFVNPTTTDDLSAVCSITSDNDELSNSNGNGTIKGILATATAGATTKYPLQCSSPYASTEQSEEQVQRALVYWAHAVEVYTEQSRRTRSQSSPHHQPSLRLAQTLLDQGNAQIRAHYHTEAEHSYQQAVDIYEELYKRVTIMQPNTTTTTGYWWQQQQPRVQEDSNENNIDNHDNDIDERDDDDDDEDSCHHSHLLRLAHALDRLGLACCALQDTAATERALLHLTRSLQLRLRVHTDPSHPHVDTINTLNHVAHALRQTNRLADACYTYQQVLSYRQDLFGYDHVSVAVTLHDLAKCQVKRNHLVDAEQLYIQSRKIYTNLQIPNTNPAVVRLRKDCIQLERLQRVASLSIMAMTNNINNTHSNTNNGSCHKDTITPVVVVMSGGSYCGSMADLAIS